MGQLQIRKHDPASVASKNRTDPLPRNFRQKILITSLLFDADESDPSKGKKQTLFVIKDNLGKGCEGTVELAFEPAKTRYCTLKFLKSSRGAGHHHLLSINSKYVSRLIDHGVSETHDGSILVTEYFKGNSLYNILLSNNDCDQAISSSIAKLQTILLQMALGMKDTFEAKIINRDIKPENVLVNYDEQIQVKLIDFGTAEEYPFQASNGAIAGTRRFMSPEAHASGLLTPASDIFSFGMVMTDCITLPDSWTLNSPVYRPEVPYWMKQLAKDCIERKPEDRPDIAHIITTLSNKSNFDYMWRKTADRLKKRLAKRQNTQS